MVPMDALVRYVHSSCCGNGTRQAQLGGALQGVCRGRARVWKLKLQQWHRKHEWSIAGTLVFPWHGNSRKIMEPRGNKGL